MSELAIVASRKSRLPRVGRPGEPEGSDCPGDGQCTPTGHFPRSRSGSRWWGHWPGRSVARRSRTRSRLKLQDVPSLAPYGETIGLAIVVAIIAFFSLVLGELVPKRLALSHPERIATLVAAPLKNALDCRRAAHQAADRFGRAHPAVIRDPAVHRTHRDGRGNPGVGQGGAKTGVLEEVEHQIVKRVFRLSDKRASRSCIPQDRCHLDRRV